jgi:predicted transcriptional regulator YheO
MNQDLIALNLKLSEANIVKEKYIGHFMTRCALYINKLDTYRKDVNHKIKNGQIQSLYKPSAKELEKEVEELYKNFDEVFLQLYPDFIDQLNSLLEPDAKYELEDNRFNTELRIFALMRLGITNVDQIADFLRCSLQTIYNYKSKVKNKARSDIANFGEEIRRLGFSDLPKLSTP